MSASNEKKDIVHKGGEFTAFGPADACMNGTYENAAPAKTLGAGATTRTEIENNPIALVGSKWESSQSEGKVGLTSGATKDYGAVTSGSQTVSAEGVPVARVSDPTSQNKVNSTGSVVGKSVVPSNESLEERAKKRCKLTRWEGSNGKASLGYPGQDKTGQPNYLELWDIDIVTFKSTRHDITKTPHEENPKCEIASHTIWYANGKVFPFYGRTAEARASGVETFDVPASLVTEAFTAAGVLADMMNGDVAGAMGKMASKFMTNYGAQRSEGEPDPDNKEDRRRVGGLGRQDYGGSSQAPVAQYAGGERFDGKTIPGLTKKPTPENKKEPIRGGSRDEVFGATFEGDPRAMMFFAWWWIMPPEIKVTATSCGGALDATLKVFPNQKTKFKFTWPLPGAAKNRQTVYDAKKTQQNLADLKSQQAAADQARSQAQGAQDAANARGHAQVVKGLEHLEKADSIGGTTGAAKKGRARQEQKADKAFDKAAEEFAKAEAALAKFNQAQATLDSILNTLKYTESSLGVLHKISAVAGVPLTSEVCKDLSLEFEFSYERTAEKMSARGWRYYTAATMGQKWTASITCGTLLGVSWKAYFSLLQFATFYVPGLAQAMSRLRIFRVDMFVSIAFKVGLGVGATKTQHDEFTVKGDMSVNFTPSIGLVVGGAGIDVVQGTIWAPTEAKLSIEPPKSKGAIIACKRSFRTSANYRVVLFPDRWWEIEASAGEIPGLSYYYNQDGAYYFEPLTLPG
ncbi:MAG: hypothetical protein FJ095_13695 [Deltaproteobacteria bacterium]|nr:hypothetical protein [Deltaproteobacteria bacterium]